MGPIEEIDEEIQLLIGEEITIDGIRFFGSPYTPKFMNWYFMRERGAEIREEWE